MMEERIAGVTKSDFRGNPITWDGEKWIYDDDGKPTPSRFVENWTAKPCKKCGQIGWSGTGKHDACLGELPGVDNACCGHGIKDNSYIRFTNGVVVTGFNIEYIEGYGE